MNPKKSKSMLIKILGSVFIIMLLAIILIGIYTSYQADKMLTEDAIKAMKDRLFLEMYNIEGVFEDLRHDVKFVSEVPPIQGIIRSDKHGGYDPDENTSRDMWRNRLASIFSVILKDRPHYNKIRFIGKSDGGREIVNVVRTEDKIRVVQDDKLRQRKNKDYFAKADSLKKGELYLSGFNLNTEQNEIVKPYPLDVKVALPVYDEALDEFYGIVIIDLNMNLLFERFNPEQDNVYFLMSDKEGYFLYHPDETMRYGFAIDTNKYKKLQSSFPETNVLFQGDWPGSIPYFQVKNGGSIITNIRVNLLDKLRGPFVILSMMSSKANIFERSVLFRNKIIFISIMVLIVLLIAAYYNTRIIIGPLKILTSFSKRIAEGDMHEVDLNVFRNDEVGDLALSFNKMALTLQNTFDDLYKRVKELNGLYTLGELTEKALDIEYLFNEFLCVVIPQSMRYPEKTLSMINFDGKDFYCHDEKDFNKYAFVNKISAPIFIAGKKRGVLTIGYSEDLPIVDHFEQKLVKSYAERLGRFIEHNETQKEKQKIWDQLLQSQKMESIGKLTGGIAHDFNNILTGIIGYATLAYNNTPKDLPSKRYMEVALDSSKKAAKLIKQLLAFSRKQILIKKISNLNSIVDNMTKMLVRMIGEDIELKLNTKTKVKNVFVDGVQIEQILMNLVINARHAMPKGGILTIETKNIEVTEDNIKEHKALVPGSYVLLSVADTGVGMSKEVQNRVFEPFFTTKKMSNASGLGLSTVYGIVKQHSGYILIDSKEGEGTTFKIYFPAVDEEEVISDEMEAINIRYGSETILIAEDEDIIRQYLTDILRPLGYKILLADSGEEAVQISDTTEEKIDVLISDVIMTEMDGWELSKKIKKRRPDIKIIFISGYLDNTDVQRKIKEAGLPFINKPIKEYHLLNKLNKLLGDKPQES